MPVYQNGALNTSALQLDDIYTVIVPPQNTAIAGIATNVGGIAGTATWGPVGAPLVVGSVGDAKNNFGAIGTSVSDLVTHLVLAIRQGANNLRGVRVTDGTDAAAAYTLADGGALSIAKLTGFYTGSAGNALTVTVAAGSSNTNATTPTSFKVQFNRPGFLAETFDNIPATGFQAALVLAVNNGQSGVRGPSSLVKAAVPTLAAPTITGGMFTPSASGGTLAAGAYRATLTLVNAQGETIASNEISPITTTGTTGSIAFVYGTAFAASVTGKLYLTAPAGAAGTEVFAIAVPNSGTVTIIAPAAGAASPATNTATIPNTNPPAIVTAAAFAGGTDGASGVNTAGLLGVDGNTRTGMYALRGTGVQHFILAGCADSTSWSTANAFAVSEGCHFIGDFPAGTSTSAAIASKQSAGLNDWHASLFKDQVVFFDSENNQQRQVNASSTYLGARCNLSPEQTTGNKQVLGLLGTEKTITGIPYSAAELGQLEAAGIKVITNPIPAGAVLGFRHGQNSSSDPTLNNETYTTMTNFLAYSLNGSLGRFVGKLQSARADDPTRRQAENSVGGFLQGLKTPTVPGSLGMIDDYSTDFATGNTPTAIGQGYLFGSAKVRYLGVVRFFVFSLEGGSLVVTAQASSPR